MNWQKLHNLSLRTKALLAVGLSVALGFAVLVTIIGYNVFDEARQSGYRQAREQANAYALDVEARFRAQFNVPRQLAKALQGLPSQTVPDRKTLDAMIIGMLKSVPEASGLWMLWEPNALDGKDDQYRNDWPVHDPTGRYMPYMTRTGQTIKQDSMLGMDQQKMAEAFRADPTHYRPPYEQSGWGDFYVVPKQRQKDTITEPYAYEVQGQSVLLSSLVTIIKNDDGKFLGVAGVDIPLQNLQASVGAFKPMETGWVTLISNGGLYVVVKDSALQGKSVPDHSLPNGLLSKLQSGQGDEYEQDGYLHVWRPIKIGETEQNWCLGVSIPLDTILAPAVKARNQAMIVGIVATLLVLALLSTLLAALTRPLKVLADTVEELASGEGDLTQRLPVKAQDEIGRTSDAFNRFIAKLQHMFLQVREQSDAVEHAAESLTQSTYKVENATSQQTSAVNAIGAGVEELTVSVQHIADTSRQQEQIARKTDEATARGQSLVSEVAQKIDTAKYSVNALSETMARLGEQSKQVDTIVSVIRGVADQTNLLALNVAIEAARAGEQGRGFAVVADEVRQLAARTSSATIEIASIVKTIQEEIEKATQKAVESRDQIDKGAERSRNAAIAIDAVNEDTANLVRHVTEIADATREQAAASTEIAQNIERISDLARTNQESVVEFGDSVRQLEKLAINLKSIVERFKL